MKLFLIAFAVIATVAADVSELPSSEYLPPEQGSASVAAPQNEYLPPVQSSASAPAPAPAPAPAHELAADGYRYKTQRRVVYRRNRRDVSHLPESEYLPPVQQDAASSVAPSQEYLPPAQQEASASSGHELAADGYRYKTQRRVVYRRNRRDVSHLPESEYLPPVQQDAASSVAPSQEYLPPAQQEASASSGHELAADGYRYKTQRRVVYRRNRRDVSHLPESEYLPPVQQDAASSVAPSQEYLPPAQQEASASSGHELAADGYRYKTQRRVVYRRNRRDVSHLPESEYLPPVQQDAASSVAPSQEYLPPAQQEASASSGHELAADGYRYKTQRRVVYRRNRRDVSHLPESEYLPPVQQDAASSVAPSQEYLPPAQQEASASSGHELAADGYRYKTQRRVVYRRNRRDVSHLPESEYLPPVQQDAASSVAPSQEYLPPAQQEASASSGHEFAADGYRYKTQRRVVYRRNRRDVSHVPQNEYLPPGQEAAPVDVAPIQDVSNAVSDEAAPSHELADDGYRYKTHRRVVYRRSRRDVSHLPSNEYLPPTQDDTPVVDAPVQQAPVASEPVPAHELADDGYRYKTHRRVVYRRNRRDVSHLPSNEYLPPTQDDTPVVDAPVQQAPLASEPVPAHELADDGYRYKTHRRVVYRRH